MSIIWIYATKEAASDEELLVLSFPIPDGSNVSKGTPILEVEGSKAVFEIESSHQGVFYRFCGEGESVPIGAVLGCICTEGENRPEQTLEEPVKYPISGNSKFNSEGIQSRFSKSAFDLIVSNGLDPEKVLPELTFVTKSALLKSLKIENSGEMGKETGITRVAFLGGGYGATLAHEIAGGRTGIQIVGVFDDSQNLLSNYGIPLLGDLSHDLIRSKFLEQQFHQLAITVQSNMKIRVELYNFCKEIGIPLLSFIHKNASIADDAQIGLGCIIMDQVRIGNSARVKENVFISGSVNIDHHCSVGTNTTFAPGVAISGAVEIGESCSFGTLVGVESGLKIGSNCKITSGNIIQADVPSDSIVKTNSKIIIRPNKAL
jgi:acetyltransferase-like isoleucine patch superfamily enzyme